MVPLWDLVVVLEGLKGLSFALLQGVELKFVSHRAVLLLALASAKHVSDCVLFFLRDERMILQPNPTCVPKVLGTFSPDCLMRSFRCGQFAHMWMGQQASGESINCLSP